MSRPSDSTSDNRNIWFLVAALVATLIVQGLGLQGAVPGLIDPIKELVLETAVIGLIDLIGAGVMLLAVALGLRILAPLWAPWKARRRARRRKVYLEGLRDTFCARGNDPLLPVISPCISSARGNDPPRPFDPQAAARFREVLEFGDPYTALRRRAPRM
jgi:hypothetical protein